MGWRQSGGSNSSIGPYNIIINTGENWITNYEIKEISTKNYLNKVTSE